MKISLKRALKLRKELEALVAKVDLPTAVQVSLLVDANLTDPTAALKPGAEALIKRVEEYQKLSEILAVVRTKIAKANIESDVEQYLAEAAHATRMIALYRKLASAGVTPEIDQLTAELSYSKQALTGQSAGYGRPERAVNVSVVLPELRDKASESVTGWKRLLETLEDSRTGKNASVQIEIADEDSQLLRQLGVL
ncbi:hypothetical protein [Bradyrhizobium sp. DASA03007]|uniref:hypothetical protein n=1 Tax=unclassified Bradyrhizobium TaxID=2631580 RepID=UPI003F7099FF